jgi:hypothetical protein
MQSIHIGWAEISSCDADRSLCDCQPKAAKEDALRALVADEKRRFAGDEGFGELVVFVTSLSTTLRAEAPDITSADVVEQLQAWNGS